MPIQLSAAVVPPARRRRKAYRPPEMLVNLHVLDLMEVSGSQMRAARSLSMHQTTVSRSYWDLAEQFRLQPERGPRKVCRWGLSTSLRFLRLASRAHRLEDGRLRLATDALHQSLLDGLPGVLQVPPCFHPAGDWATLVAQGVIDGAIVSSICHDQTLASGKLPRWPGVKVLPLGTLPLQLVAAQRWADVWAEQVLVPAAQVMPLLHEQLEPCFEELERASRAWQDPQDWLEQLHQRPVAAPVCPAMAPKDWWREQGLVPVAQQLSLQEQLWLLLPEDLQAPAAGKATLRVIQRRAFRAVGRGEEALLEAMEMVGEGPGTEEEAVA
ncbi:MAG: hypothetical protein ACKO8I_19200 [Cyanobacteriota bacterium]